MDRLYKKVQKMEKDYKFSARRYSYYALVMSVPSIVLTSLSSIFSFMGSSEYVDKDIKDYCIVTVAFLTTFSTMLQTINASCEFNVKKLKFTEATQELNHILDRIFFENESPNEEHFIDAIEKEIEGVKNNCKFIPLETKIIENKNENTPLVSTI